MELIEVLFQKPWVYTLSSMRETHTWKYCDGKEKKFNVSHF